MASFSAWSSTGGGVLLEDGVLLRAGGVLELEDGLGVEEVVLPLAPPLVLPAHLELPVRPLGGPALVGHAVPGGHLGGQHREADAADAAGRAGEVLVDQGAVEPDGLEDLGAGVGGHGRDAHLGHDLEHALAGRLHVVAPGLAGRDALEQPLGDHVVDGVEGQVRVDGGGAVADEQRHVMDLAGVAGLDDQADLGAGLLPHQVVVDGRGQQQRRDGRPLLGGVAVGEHDDVGPVGDGLGDPAAHVGQGPGQGLPAGRGGRPGPAGLAHLEQAVDGEGLEARASRRAR